MEIFYCSECHSRISSVDIDDGKGVTVGTGTFCKGCAKKLGILDQAQPKPVPSASPNPTARLRTRPVESKPKADMPIMAILGIVVGLLIIILTALLVSSNKPAPPQPEIQPDAVTADEPGTTPASTDDSTPAAQPEPLPEAQEPVPEEPEIVWQHLLTADSLEADGWKHVIKDDTFGEGFTLTDGMVSNTREPHNMRIISKKLDINNGEIAFTFIQNGQFTECRVIDTRNISSQASIGLDGKWNGRHTMLIQWKGRQIDFIIDGRKSTESFKKAPFNNNIAAPFKRGVYLRFDTLPNTTLAITGIKYRSYDQ